MRYISCLNILLFLLTLLFLFFSGMTESPGSPLGIIQRLHGFPIHMAMSGYNHLADTLTIIHRKRLGR